MLTRCPVELHFIPACNLDPFLQSSRTLIFGVGQAREAILACSIPFPLVICRALFCENMAFWCLGAFGTFKIGFVDEK